MSRIRCVILVGLVAAFAAAVAGCHGRRIAPLAAGAGGPDPGPFIDCRGIDPARYLDSSPQPYPPPETGPLSLALRSAPVPPGEHVMTVEAEIAGRAPRPPRERVALAIVLDTSGSMAADGRLDAARSALAEVVTSLQPRDTVLVISAGLEPAVVARAGAGERASEAADAIREMEPAAGDSLAEAVGLAERELAELAGPFSKRMVLVATDARLAAGTRTTQAVRDAIDQAGASGVAVRLVAAGRSPAAELDAALRATGGAMAFAPEEAWFARELRLAALALGAPAASDLVLGLEPAPGVSVERVYGRTVADAGPEGGLKVLLPGPIYPGERRTVVIELAAADGFGEPGAAVLTGRLAYADPAGGSSRPLEAEARFRPGSRGAGSVARNRAIVRAAEVVLGAAHATEGGDAGAAIAALRDAVGQLDALAARRPHDAPLASTLRWARRALVMLERAERDAGRASGPRAF